MRTKYQQWTTEAIFLPPPVEYVIEIIMHKSNMANPPAIDIMTN